MCYYYLHQQVVFYFALSLCLSVHLLASLPENYWFPGSPIPRGLPPGMYLRGRLEGWISFTKYRPQNTFFNVLRGSILTSPNNSTDIIPGVELWYFKRTFLSFQDRAKLIASLLKFLPEMYIWSKKLPFSYRSHPDVPCWRTALPQWYFYLSHSYSI